MSRFALSRAPESCALAGAISLSTSTVYHIFCIYSIIYDSIVRLFIFLYADVYGQDAGTLTGSTVRNGYDVLDATALGQRLGLSRDTCSSTSPGAPSADTRRTGSWPDAVWFELHRGEWEKREKMGKRATERGAFTGATTPLHGAATRSDGHSRGARPSTSKDQRLESRRSSRRLARSGRRGLSFDAVALTVAGVFGPVAL
jgi:hypothetical protein